jgi:sucrose-6-phosphate hydrolase SacC (GH32 family)
MPGPGVVADDRVTANRTSFAFHAVAPSGEWINDPNGLIFAEGAYRLFVQHSAAAPDFQEIGWGRFSSPDLLEWRWDGPALPPTAMGSTYSGSVVATKTGWDAYFTRHNPDGPWQDQQRASAGQGASDWLEKHGSIGPSGRNMRDPFVFWSAAANDWRMLVAEPCDWTDWRAGPPSRLQIWRSEDRDVWHFAGTIGPWLPSGIMWEVPVLLHFGAWQALIISVVDRRYDLADCSILYWIGEWSGSDFTPASGFPAAGLPLDLGPDCYAAIPNCEAGWPADERVLIGWASNWQTARAIDWPGGAKGGPITLPRRVRLDAAALRLRQEPIAGAEAHVRWSHAEPGEVPFAITLARGSSLLVVIGDPRTGSLEVKRIGSEALAWSSVSSDILERVPSRRFTLFEDGPLLELFIAPDGLVITAALPGEGPLAISAGSGGPA